MDFSKSTTMQSYPDTFTEAFANYCRANYLSPRLFHDMSELIEKMPRYIRLRPQYSLADLAPQSCDGATHEDTANLEELRVMAAIAASLGIHPSIVSEVEWLPRSYCFAVPRDVAIGRSAAYRSGVISAMDAASMAAVVALRPCAGESVWDVCCSPGMKLSFIADAIGATGLAVGTDVSVERLFIARSVLKKHKAENVCLLAADGSFFSFCSVNAALDKIAWTMRRNKATGLTEWEERQLRQLRKRRLVTLGTDTTVVNKATSNDPDGKHKATVSYITDIVRQKIEKMKLNDCEHPGFDRVIVDAECSHDGSLAHIYLNDATKRPFAASGVAASAEEPQYAGIDNVHRMQHLWLDSQDDTCGKREEDMSPLQQLQLSLLINGYAQLKPGGTLVYSTCSFTYQQNEYIVRKFFYDVNSSDEIKQQYKGSAVICHPFSYTHETVSLDMVSPIVRLNDTQVELLNQLLATDKDPYGIIAAGELNKGKHDSDDKFFAGVRLWPHKFLTSFQFIAKIWKQPLSSLTHE